MLHRIIILSFTLITFMYSDSAAALTPGEVEESLTCYACPGEPLNVDRCSGGDQMKAAIRRMVDEGKSKKEILDYFAGQFGDSILTIPPKKGFNLVAYIFPFIGLILGAAIAFVIVKKWSASGKIYAPGPDKKTEEIMDETMKKKIENEMKKLEEE